MFKTRKLNKRLLTVLRKRKAKGKLTMIFLTLKKLNKMKMVVLLKTNCFQT